VNRRDPVVLGHGHDSIGGPEKRHALDQEDEDDLHSDSGEQYGYPGLRRVRAEHLEEDPNAQDVGDAQHNGDHVDYRTHDCQRAHHGYPAHDDARVSGYVVEILQEVNR
jgi:hypothetical protein